MNVYNVNMVNIAHSWLQFMIAYQLISTVSQQQINIQSFGYCTQSKQLNPSHCVQHK